MRDGWEDDEWSLDDEQFGNDDHLMSPSNPAIPEGDGQMKTSLSFAKVSDHQVNLEHSTTNVTSVFPPSPVSALENYVMGQLRSYSLEFTTNAAALRDALNQTLHQKFHNDGAALHDLTAYYQAKPALYEYTLQKELSRMEYRVVMQCPTTQKTTVTLDDPEEIRSVFLANRRKYQQQPLVDLLWRAANQSLLADALCILTSPSGVVRPQYFSTAVAHKVSFLVDLVHGFINCDAILNVSIPSGSATTLEASRVPMAEVQLNIIYSPAMAGQQNQHQPMLQCYITDVTPSVLLRSDPAKYFLYLRDAAKSLTRDWIDIGYSNPEIEALMGDLHCRQERQQQQHVYPRHELSRSNFFSTSSQVLREALLHPDTHQAIYQASLMAMGAACKTNTGIVSALKQLDSATGVSTKFKLFSNIKFLPTSEDILEVEQEEEDAGNSCYVCHTGANSAVQLVHTLPPNSPPRNPISLNQQTVSPRVPLFGGLLMTGLSRMSMSDRNTSFPRPPLNAQIGPAQQSRPNRDLPGHTPSISSVDEKARNEEGWSDNELDIDSDTSDNDEAFCESNAKKNRSNNAGDVKSVQPTKPAVAPPLAQSKNAKRLCISQSSTSSFSPAIELLAPFSSCHENVSLMSSSFYSSGSSSSDFVHIVSTSNTVWKNLESEVADTDREEFTKTRKRWIHPLALTSNARGKI